MRIHPVFRFFAIVSCIILGLCYNASAGDIFRLENLEVTEKNPTTFVLYTLLEGDQIIVDYERNRGDIRNLRIEIISVSGTEPVPVFQYQVPGQDYEIPEDGNYYFRFSSSDDVNINVTFSNTREEPESGTVARFKFDSKVLETENQNEFLRFLFNLQQGDQLTFASGDQKSLLLTVQYFQGAVNRSIGSGAQFTIGEDGGSTFLVYINKNDPTIQDQIKQKVLKIFGKKDLGFRDINLTITRPYVAPPSAQSPGGGFDPNTNQAAGNDKNAAFDVIAEMQKANEMQAEREAEIREQMQKSQENTLEFLKLQQELAAIEKEKQEQDRKNKIRILSRAQYEINARKKHSENDVFTVYPKNNILTDPKSNEKLASVQVVGNRMCKQINLEQQTVDERYNTKNWFFMTYVGSMALMDSIVEEEMQTQLGFSPSDHNIWKQFAINIHRNTTPLYPGDNWTYYDNHYERPIYWPNEKTHPEIFGEDVSFAIVNESYLTSYLNGEWYSPIYERQNVKMHHGMLPLPLTREATYFCATNNNLNTPIEVSFYYFVLEALNKNQNNQLIEMLGGQ